jgi:TRAP-type C4-dicarboxylate transport system substrate-binding protein
VDEGAQRSGGSVVVEPLWDAGAETAQGFERGVAHLVVDGGADLGLAAGRAWDDAGVSALTALQAPFLITTDALAEAVATSAVADTLLASLGATGVTGLAMWPEDLRHPVAFEPCVAPLTDPAQFQGLTVRAIASSVTTDLLSALGATHTSVDDFDPLVEACEIQAAESGLRQGQSLPGKPTFTGDVTFFPKMQVLVANGDALARLTPAQQDAIRQAAIVARDQAITEHPSDAEAAAAWCTDGGRVVLAGPDGVAAFEAAAGPVLEGLAEDPIVAVAIDGIRALRDTITPEPPAAACDAGPAPTFAAAPIQSDLPTPGTWRTHHTLEEMVAWGLTEIEARAQGMQFTITFGEDGRWTGLTTCGGAYSIVDGWLRLTSELDLSQCGTPPWDLRWIQDGDTAQVSVSPQGNAIDNAIFTGEWIRIE